VVVFANLRADTPLSPPLQLPARLLHESLNQCDRERIGVPTTWGSLCLLMTMCREIAGATAAAHEAYLAREQQEFQERMRYLPEPFT
jgi:hypothetical protein